MLGLRGNTFAVPPDADPYDQVAAAQRLSQATQLGDIADSRSILQDLLDQEGSPEVSLERQRRPGLAGGLGAALLGIENPTYATQYAQGVRQVERANAEIAAREALANQVQQGYQRRREQQITQSLAELGLQETRVRAQGQAALAELDAEKKLAGLERLRAMETSGTDAALEFDDKYGDKFYADLIQIANADPEVDTTLLADRLSDIVSMAPPSLQSRWAQRLQDVRDARAEEIARAKKAKEGGSDNWWDWVQKAFGGNEESATTPPRVTGPSFTEGLGENMEDIGEAFGRLDAMMDQGEFEQEQLRDLQNLIPGQPTPVANDFILQYNRVLSQEPATK